MLTVKIGRMPTKYITLLYVLGLCAVVWIFLLLLYWPQQVRNQDLRGQLTAQEQRLRSVEAFALAYPEADKYIGELERRRVMVDKMLPANPDISDFLIQVERAAKASGAQVTQIKPGVAVNKTGYREIPLEILVKGSFFQTADFLKKLEDSQRFNTVQTLSLQSRQNMLDCKINAFIYIFGTTPPPPAAGKPQG